MPSGYLEESCVAPPLSLTPSVLQKDGAGFLPTPSGLHLAGAMRRTRRPMVGARFHAAGLLGPHQLVLDLRKLPIELFHQLFRLSPG